MLEVMVGKELSGSSDALCNNKDVEQLRDDEAGTQSHLTSRTLHPCAGQETPL